MIFYLSATGNSRWAALRLAAATREQAIDIAREMADSQSPYNRHLSYTLHAGERLGFVFPVHGWRVPRLMRTFLEQVKITVADTDLKKTAKKTPFTYVVCTAGDDIGLTVEWFNRSLTPNETLNHLHITKADSAYSIQMPNTYVGLPFMDTDPQPTERAKKAEAQKRLEQIAENIRLCKKGITQTRPGAVPWIKSTLIGSLFERLLITDRLFHVSHYRCKRCGICKNVCPVDNIEGGKGLLPKWTHTHHCLTCFACYHHCPHHAIEFGRQTQKKGQYFYK